MRIGFTLRVESKNPLVEKSIFFCNPFLGKYAENNIYIHIYIYTLLKLDLLTYPHMFQFGDHAWKDKQGEVASPVSSEGYAWRERKGARGSR